MAPYLVRHIIYSSKAFRTEFNNNKKKYAIINKRNTHSSPNDPQNPNWLLLFIGGITSIYAINMIRNMIYKK